MNVLIVGGGGREHALAWKIKQSPYVEQLYVAPGNAGTAQIAKNVDISQKDIRGLANFAEHNSIDLTIVGPEDPLAEGITDYFNKRGLNVFGPTQAAAKIESSKVFAKEFMQRFHIPTAGFVTFDTPEGAIKFVEEHEFPIVIKTDGLAGGKGSIVAKNIDEARDAIVHMMIERTWGDAGKTVVIEEFLRGTEISVLAMTDGDNAVLLKPAQDYKRAYDNNEGPNTGGMGCVAPHPLFDPELEQITMEEIIIPTLEGLKYMGAPFKGILYAGLMLTESGPKVLEFNCRFGDPETQAILPLLKSDLLEMMLFALENRVLEADVEWHEKKAVGVVMASGGYPKRYKKGYPISGLDEVAKIPQEQVIVFHAGTDRRGENIITNGGRVLTVVGQGETYAQAIDNAYNAVQKIHFEKAFYRKDIGREYRNL
ncbi:MAG: phosphoribosylamine--glycine ligase [Thermoplasmata archaeon]|nr:MAG: phosphoribosylamine--glycine ligase [Thermoplasmata archaeon]